METVTPEQYKAMQRKPSAYKRRPTPPYVPGEDPRIILLSRRKIPMNANVKPEDRLSILLADCLCILSLASLFNGVWTCIKHEGKAHELTELISKASGKIAGATDFVFGAEYRSAWIELKVKPNKLSANQERYREWCRIGNVPWACYTALADTYEARRETVIQILNRLAEWGFIPNLPAALTACQSKLHNPLGDAP